MLILFLVDTKCSEDHHHHKQIVYRQRLFYQITRDIGNGHVLAILMQTTLEVIRVQLKMRSITRSYSLKIVEIVNSVYHVAMKPQEYRETQCQDNPNPSPDSCLLDRHHMCLTVDSKHVYQQYGYNEDDESA